MPHCFAMSQTSLPSCWCFYQCFCCGSSFKRCSSLALLGPGKQRVELVRAGKVGGAVSQYFEHYTGEELLEFVIFEHVGCIEKFGNRRAEKFAHTVSTLCLTLGYRSALRSPFTFTFTRVENANGTNQSGHDYTFALAKKSVISI